MRPCAPRSADVTGRYRSPPMPEVRERVVESGPARLFVRDVGEGRPLVVVHGGPDFDHRYLLPEVDRLAPLCRLVYYDQRGRGRSFLGEVAADVTVRSEVEDLDVIRRALELGSIVVLGHSWGALVALEYALAFPAAVSHLILISPAPASPDDAAALRDCLRVSRSIEQRDRMAALAASPAFRAGDVEADAAYYRIHFAAALRRPQLVDEVVGRLRRGFSEAGIVAARAIEEHLYEQTWRSPDWKLLTRLGQLRIPTLIIHGDADLIPLDIARHIAAAIPDARLEVLRDCGHFAYLEQPGPTYRAIAGFLGPAGSGQV
jgi:proline iminopeptidase